MKTSFAAILSLGLLSTASFAGQCPEDQKLTEPREIENAPDIGVTRPVLHEVDMTGWRGMGNFHLRMRLLTVAVGGVVPTHNHEDRPSIVYVLSGEIVEHTEFCAVPVLHKTGESSPEFGKGHKHWWANETDQPVVLISADVIPVAPKPAPLPMPDTNMP